MGCPFLRSIFLLYSSVTCARSGVQRQFDAEGGENVSNGDDVSRIRLADLNKSHTVGMCFPCR